MDAKAIEQAAEQVLNQLKQRNLSRIHQKQHQQNSNK
tara:strand:- start:2074 stop:2184 length:111 start_codon:yes stop_codon:yes gene_type:complete